MTNIDQRIANLSPEKLALLMERLGKSAPEEPTGQGEVRIRARERSGPEPLSFAQERLWFLDRLAPGTSEYNVPGALRIRGDLDVTALEQALDETLRRHEVLRTRFEERDGRPVQVVEPFVRSGLRRVDSTRVALDRMESEARGLTRDVAHRGFDLQRAPLLRIVLIRLRPRDHVLLFTLHHIVCDGWSVHLLMRELVELMRTHGDGVPSLLEEPRFQYADFARWQRARLQGNRRGELVSYWREQLRGASSELGLRASDSVRSVGETDGAPAPTELQRSLPSSLATAVIELGRRERATSFMALVALLAATLHVETGRADLCIGANAATRGEMEAEELIGFFINQIVLRIRLAPTQTFRDLVRHVRDVVSEAHAHQDLPFEQLVDLLRAEPGRGDEPLFRVKIEVQEEMAGSARLPGLDLELWDTGWTPLRGDLLMTASSSGDGLETSWSHDAQRLPSTTIRRLAETFRHAAEIVAEAPETTLEALAARIAEARERRRRQDRRQLRSLDVGKLKRTRRRGIRLDNETKG